jgi:hypothetical protein
MEQRWRQRHQPARGLRQPVAAAPGPDELAYLAGEERREEGHEERRGRVAAGGVGGQDQQREADGVEREDVSVPAAHAVVGLERPGEEVAVPARRVIVLERHVVVAQDAVGHHQVVRLVALGPDLELRARGDDGVDGEHHREEEPARRAPSRGGQRRDHPGQGQREERRTGQRADTRHRRHEEQQRYGQQACARDARRPAESRDEDRAHRDDHGEMERRGRAEQDAAGPRGGAAHGQEGYRRPRRPADDPRPAPARHRSARILPARPVYR